MLSNHDHILITDIGSTTTKGLLLEKRDGALHFLAQCETPTTVEKPFEDVKIGLFELIGKLEDESGIPLIDSDGRIVVPYLTTSSAGGGLQILVFGLSSVETGTVAEITAYGAGGVILKTFTIDDRISPIDKMRLMQELHPDMVLMAGGLDDGNIAGVVQLAELLSLARPTPKFRKSEKIPLVFCGNVTARSFVTKVLEKNFEMHLVENVRPNMHEMNIEPAKNKIHELFMENVMERAPGYAELKNSVITDILPTPAGVQNILDLYAAGTDKDDESGNSRNIVMVDIGGATTDIFSIISGESHRTVAANIGMSYSLSNIMAAAGMEEIMAHLPDKFPENEVRNYITNKTLNPTHVPKHDAEKLIEYAAAVEGVDIAWKMHMDMNFKIAQVGFLERHKARKSANPFEELFQLQVKKQFFQLSDIDLIIGAGGIISHVEDSNYILHILAEGFKPSGVTLIAIDRYFKSPHLGVLANLDTENTIRLFEEECLQFIGYVIAPTGKINPKKVALEIMDKETNEMRKIKGGDVLFLKNGGNLEIACNKRLFFRDKEQTLKLETDLPILLDCRGRGDYFTGEKLAQFDIPEFDMPVHEFKTAVGVQKSEIEKGEYEIERKLPYKGDIFAAVGDKVIPDSIIGENKFGPPRLYMLDLNRFVGYGKKMSEDKIAEGLLVKAGDKVSMGQKIFETKVGFTKSYYSSPVRGIITQIEDLGLIVMREIQDYDGKPHKVDVAKQLDIKPSHIAGHLRFRLGDFVEENQALAIDHKRAIFVKSPATGTIKKIDKKSGKVTVQYDISPIPLKAFARGEVTEVIEGHSVKIKTIGTILYGIIGFGQESSGDISIVENFDEIESAPTGSILVSFEHIDEHFLRRCAAANITGIIAPSVENSDWVEFYGQEMGVALTGDENIPFTIVLTEGFGKKPMNAKYRELLEKTEGKTAGLSGRTQIRAGVIRPAVMIYD